MHDRDAFLALGAVAPGDPRLVPMTVPSSPARARAFGAIRTRSDATSASSPSRAEKRRSDATAWLQPSDEAALTYAPADPAELATTARTERACHGGAWLDHDVGLPGTGPFGQAQPTDAVARTGSDSAAVTNRVQVSRRSGCEQWARESSACPMPLSRVIRRLPKAELAVHHGRLRVGRGSWPSSPRYPIRIRCRDVGGWWTTSRSRTSPRSRGVPLGRYLIRDPHDIQMLTSSGPREGGSAGPVTPS